MDQTSFGERLGREVDSALQLAARKLDESQSALQRRTDDLDAAVEARIWAMLTSLLALKEATGNLHMRITDLATRRAELFLLDKLGFKRNRPAKRPGANGIDIEGVDRGGEKVLAEVKTTSPCEKGILQTGDVADKFGARQWNTIEKDLQRLRTTDAHRKFLFLIDSSTFRLLRQGKGPRTPPGVTIGLLRESTVELWSPN